MNNLYEKDCCAWVEVQTEFLKKGYFDKLDIENIIEELISVGNSERNKLVSHLVILMLHMLKIKYQPCMKSRSWDLSIKNARKQAMDTIQDNPSLKSSLPALIKRAYSYARLEAAKETGQEEETFPEICPWTVEEILN
jgi:Domain of unknown function DUF29